jgi:hypothetical protein
VPEPDALALDEHLARAVHDATGGAGVDAVIVAVSGLGGPSIVDELWPALADGASVHLFSGFAPDATLRLADGATVAAQPIRRGQFREVGLAGGRGAHLVGSRGASATGVRRGPRPVRGRRPRPGPLVSHVVSLDSTPAVFDELAERGTIGGEVVLRAVVDLRRPGSFVRATDGRDLPSPRGGVMVAPLAGLAPAALWAAVRGAADGSRHGPEAAVAQQCTGDGSVRLGWVKPPLWSDIERSLAGAPTRRSGGALLLLGTGGWSFAARALRETLRSEELVVLDNPNATVEADGWSVCLAVSGSGTTLETRLLAGALVRAVRHVAARPSRPDPGRPPSRSTARRSMWRCSGARCPWRSCGRRRGWTRRRWPTGAGTCGRRTSRSRSGPPASPPPRR